MGRLVALGAGRGVHHGLLALWVIAGLLAGCSTTGSLVTRARSPYDQYQAMLKQSGLDQTALGIDWARAGSEAFAKAVSVTLPFQETGYFPPGEAAAVAYHVDLRRGRKLELTVTHDSVPPGRLFVDLFVSASDGAPRHVASLAPDNSVLTYDVERDAAYLLRVQPELLRGGRFTISERTLASVTFPVLGLTSRAVQSEFGAERDAGRREHQGIDIFAPRGTAVVAAGDGVAQNSTNNLGGNVLWLRDSARGLTYYYAHLDKWHFDGTTRVRAGDIVGYVGNTGNARATAPHLHFGIYDNGAIDPLPFVAPDDGAAPAPTADVERLGERLRVSVARTALREGSGVKTPVRSELMRAAVARALGASQSSLRVLLPDGSTGYVSAAALAPLTTTLRRQRVPAGALLRETPSAAAPVMEIAERELTVDVLGQFGSFDLVRTPQAREGWLERSAGSPR